MSKSNISRFLIAGFIGILGTLSQTSLAANLTCTGNGDTATLGSATACTDLYKGNLAHKEVDDKDPTIPLDAFGMSWELLVQDVNDGVPGTASNGATAGALVITQAAGGGDNLAGTWTIDPSKTGIYNTFVIGLKPNGSAGYWMVEGLTGTYSDLNHGLSHANLYGKVGPVLDPVPLPAAAWLFGSALLGLVTVGRRRLA